MTESESVCTPRTDSVSFAQFISASVRCKGLIRVSPRNESRRPVGCHSEWQSRPRLGHLTAAIPPFYDVLLQECLIRSAALERGADEIMLYDQTPRTSHRPSLTVEIRDVSIIIILIIIHFLSAAWLVASTLLFWHCLSQILCLMSAVFTAFALVFFW